MAANITYRINSNPTLPGSTTVKNSPLTNLEIDANFKALASEFDNFDALPDQTGETGKFLTTDGSIASWAVVDVVTNNVTIAAGDRLLISDSSDSSKIRGGIAFGSTTTTYLNNAGTFTTPPNTIYTLPAATATVRGGIELFSDTVQSVAATAVSTVSSRTYGVQVNADGQAVVNVPWVDTNTTYSVITEAEVDAGTSTTARTISGLTAKYIIDQAVAATSGGATLTNDLSTNTSQFLTMSRSSTGDFEIAYVANTKLYFNPSTGTLNATVFNSLSDKNKKDNIEIITDGLEVIDQLVGVDFTWKDNGEKSSGVIAQDLEEVLPWLVKDDNGEKSVNYVGIIGYLIEAVKELNEKVTILENK